jgi:nonsense-mediated mRNA decay protein 3
MICIKCGKNEVVLNGLCESCYLEEIKLTFPDIVRVENCPKCNAVKVKNRWYYSNEEDHIKHLVRDSIVSNDSSIITDITSITYDLKSKNGYIDIDYTFARPGIARISGSRKIAMSVLRQSCPQCNKLTGNYYEAVIQIRSFKEKFDLLEALSYAEKSFSAFSSMERGSFISKIEKKREGYDMYLGNNSDAKKLVRMIQFRYPSVLKVSKTLAGRKNGEDFYRYTYSIRILGIVKGSIIRYRKKEMIIKEISPSKIKAMESSGNYPIGISQSDLVENDFELLDESPERRKLIVLESRSGESQLMDPVTFRTFTVRREIDGAETEVSVYGNEYFFD